MMLNALLWMAKVDVPKDGVKDNITAEDLTQNLDESRRGSSSVPVSSGQLQLPEDGCGTAD